MHKTEEKEVKNFGVKTEMSFSELCKSLDKQHERYLSGEMKTYTIEEVWEKYKNRKNTFLTSK